MRIAFVSPFFGALAAGGAEAECRQTALRLAAAGVDVEVFTTCLLDLGHDWNVNVHRPGTSRDGGALVHRFRVGYTDLGPFLHLNERVLGGAVLTPEEEKRFVAMFIHSEALYRALAARRDAFDWVCLIPYLFGTTVYGARLCAPRTVLIPCLHDEPYARMDVYRRLFRSVARVVYHTESERRQAEGLYGTEPARGLLVGEGVDTEFASDGDRFRTLHGLRAPFVLYVGRKDRTKNVDTLIEFFSRYRKRRPGPLQLVLLGPGRLPVPPETAEHVVDLGFVPEQDKRDAYSAAELLVQPSRRESFSLVIMESWACGRPCLVHADCAVTRDHAAESGGGLFFRNYAEFEGCLDRLLSDRGLAARMGRSGQAYVRSRFAWDVIVRRYVENVLAPAAPRP